MNNSSKKEKAEACNNKQYKKINIEQKNEDYCIIKGNKIEGNACNTIVNNK